MRVMPPLISVIIGTLYLQEDLTPLERAVKSILTQSLSDFELLICGDGSTEAANAFLDQCTKEDPRVRLIRSKGKTGLPEKLNGCLAKARGEFIARMDDDDFSYPDRFEKQIAFLNANPDIAFVGSNVLLVCNGEPVGRKVLPAAPTVRDFYMTQPYIHPALMFRREALKKVCGYSEEHTCVLCEDYDLLLRLYTKGFHGANLNEVLLDYTIPETAKGNRTMRHRWNESVTRWRRFYELGVLPRALPYVIKPLVVGLLPGRLLGKIKKAQRGGCTSWTKS